MKNYQFQIGDIVRKTSGTKHIKVTQVHGSGRDSYNKIYGRYTHSGAGTEGYSRNFVLVDADSEGNNMTQTKLYQVKDNPERFGTLLAINAQGLLVLDMKDTKNTEIFKDEAVEIVTPFTFDVKYLGQNNTQTFTGKDTIKEGDFLIALDTPTLMRVTKVNTKSQKNCKTFVGRKLTTEEV